MTTAAITILGIFAGSGTIIIVALIGFIGKGIEKRFDTLFKELGKYQTEKMCNERSGKIQKDVNGIGTKVSNHEKVNHG